MAAHLVGGLQHDNIGIDDVYNIYIEKIIKDVEGIQQVINEQKKIGRNFIQKR